MNRSFAQYFRWWTLTVWLALVSLVLGCGPGPSAKEKRIVLLTFDTLRWDSFFGSVDQDTNMPLTLARAKTGIVFENFFTASNVTQPSHAAMLTGQHPWNLGIFRNGMTLKDEYETVAEVMKTEGWQTAAVVGSFPVARRFGFAQGFDTFVEAFSRGGGEGRRWEGHEMPEQGFFGSADVVTTAAIETLNQMGAGPQFIWIQYFDPHSPYGDSTDSPGPSIKKVLNRAEAGDPIAADLQRMRMGYGADVRFLDNQLDRFIARLESDSEAFDTWVIGVSDHGESLGEGGSLGHGKRLSEEQIRVPCFIFKVGDDFPANLVTDEKGPVGSVDVAVTILAIAGMNRHTSGRNLLDPGEGETAPVLGMRRLFKPGATEMRTDGHRYPVDEPLFFSVGRSGQMIIGNSMGLSPDGHPTHAGRSQSAINTFAELEQMVVDFNHSSPIDDETKLGLEALGYID